MPSDLSPRLAVIGSGPAGCYFAQSVLRGAPKAEVTIFDRLASPFGLVRYGVAADHQHTKAITRQFERFFAQPNVRFAGNVDIGRDITLDELREAYDAVILATGLSADRSLGLPGEALLGIYGSGGITRVLNSHPGERPEFPSLGSDVVVIGGGNVAIDLLRFLVKDRSGYEASDISDEALEAYLANPAERVTVLHRSGPAEAKSDPQILKELAALPRGRYESPDLADASPAPEGDRQATARLAAFAELTSVDREPTTAPVVSLRFNTIPVEFIGTDQVEAVRVETSRGTETIAATSVITAIGFEQASSEISELTEEPAETGRIEPGMYRTGWAKRGPRGAIPENRACAKGVAEELLADLEAGTLTVGSPGFDALSNDLHERSISYEQWTKLDSHERESAAEGRVRRKLTDHNEMVNIARDAQTGERN
ncbi:FAD-dependent oxidoreductase [Leucobacter denitrificans]|uniref:ferredoxin--NADP(+) reductase n=1 Tax=Leucobacter denitrificans TaxID=683042 RepID=A0A7G9S2G7_9MICO|nr:FAD-dependent oxidoreductase [Leucobacter denitrificans]QNN62042.1 FAD-dependent oxidoreductase [Leucobacter denitrificans]